MNLTCSICTELFTPSDDVRVTACGHIFHNVCLLQWLERSRTCPQCRAVCLQNGIVRLYFNVASAADNPDDVFKLQDKLDNCKLDLQTSNRKLNEANKEISDLKDRQKEKDKVIIDLKRKLEKGDIVLLTYSEKVKMLQFEVRSVMELRTQLNKLQEELNTLKGLQTLLSSSTAEVKKVLDSEKDPRILASWVEALKRELKISEMKKDDLRSTLKTVQKDMRSEILNNRIHQNRVSQLESENHELLKKVQQLEKAMSKNDIDINLTSKEAFNTSTSTQPLNKNLSKAGVLNLQTIISPDKPIHNFTSICKDDSNSPYLNIKSSNIGLTAIIPKKRTGLKPPINNNRGSRLVETQKGPTNSGVVNKSAIRENTKNNMATNVNTKDDNTQLKKRRLDHNFH